MDIIWLLNVIVDSMILWMTSIILKQQIKGWKIILGGLLGSLIIFIGFIPSIHQYAGNLGVKILVSILMVFTVFGFKRLRYFVSCLFTFYLVTFLTGGILIGLHYLLMFDFELQSTIFLASVKGFGDPISWFFVIFCFPVAWYFSKQRIDSIATVNIQYDQLVDVEVKINGVCFQLTGLIDSGNQLYDPLSKMPVMIVSIGSLEEVLPEEIVAIAQDPDQLLHDTKQMPATWYENVRFIPAQVVGKSHQLLTAFKPDLITIEKGMERWIVKKALIHFTNQVLSSEDKFECIVHPKMVAGASHDCAS